MAMINISNFMTWEENGEYDCKISYIKDDVKQLSLKQIPIINELIKNRLNHDNFMTAETIWNIVVSNYDKKRFKINEDYSPEGVKAHLKRLKKEKYWKDVIVSQYDYKKYNKEGANAGYKIEFDVLKLDSAAKEKIRDYVSEAESSKLLNSNVFKEQDNVPVNGSTQKSEHGIKSEVVDPNDTSKKDILESIPSEDNFVKKHENDFANLQEGDLLYWGMQNETCIPWKVLAIRNNKALIICNVIIDKMPYHEPGGDITWKDCTLRMWLNNEFLKEYFTSMEQEKILSCIIPNVDNPQYMTNGGETTIDKVFLFSSSEAVFYSEELNDDDSMLDWVDTWWLRSPGENPDFAAFGCPNDGDDDDVDYSGDYVNNVYGVRPVLWINLKSDCSVHDANDEYKSIFDVSISTEKLCIAFEREVIDTAKTGGNVQDVFDEVDEFIKKHEAKLEQLESEQKKLEYLDAEIEKLEDKIKKLESENKDNPTSPQQ